jgi:phage terminase small subunit
MSDVGLNAQRILMEYMKIAFSDITDLVEFGQEEVIVRNKKGDIVKETSANRSNSK